MAERQRVFAGDGIRAKVRFQHRANITRIAATFSNEAEGGRDTVDFYETRDNPSVYRADKGALTTESEAVLVADITYEHGPGVYRCVMLTATTAGGDEISFSRLPDFSFEVVSEPKDAPQLIDFAPARSDWELY